MKQLSLPVADPLAHFDAIAAAKYKGRGERLIALRPTVEALYHDYSRCAPEFASLSKPLVAKLTPDKREDLLHCYTGQNCAPRDALVAALSQVTQGCPYCGINPEAHTLDHYLPKNGYEQYAIFPPNIIPSCGRCNNLRGERWQIDGLRTTLHFYFDPIDPINPVLSARIGVENGEFAAEYSISPNPRAAAFSALYRRHCELLGLISVPGASASTETSRPSVPDKTPRFKTASIGRLKVIMQEIHDLRATTPDFDVVGFYTRKAETFTEEYGANHWETALYRAITASPEFIRASIERADRLRAAGGHP